MVATLFKTPTGLLLVFISIIIVISIVSGNLGGMEGIRLGACEKHPNLPFCKLLGTNATTEEYLEAKHSTKALACAINSVYAGRKLECVDEINEKSEASNGKLEAAIRCGGSRFECRVEKFDLTQHDADRQFIKGHGDPEFLVYWNTFPPGIADSWANFDSMAESVADYYVAWRLIGYATTLGGKSLFVPLLVRTAVRYRESGVTRTALAPLAFGIRTALGERATAALGGIVNDVYELVGAYVDSKKGKFIPRGSAIVLKSPYKGPEVFKLDTNYPVLFAQGDKKLPNFVAISPCKETLFVKKSVAECNPYSHNFDTNATICQEADEKSSIDDKDCKVGQVHIRENFLVFTRGDFIPNRVADLYNAEKSYWQIYKSDSYTTNTRDDSFEVIDPISRISFIYEFKGHSGNEITYRLDKVTITHEGERRVFDLDDDGEYDDEIKFNLHIECKYEDNSGDPDEGSKLTCDEIDTPTITVNDDSCEYCKEFKKHIERFDTFEFSRKETKKEVRGKRVSGWRNTINMWYDDKSSGGYRLIFSDGNQDGRAERLDITKRERTWVVFWESAGIMSLQDTPSLQDAAIDGKMETLDIHGCRTNAIFVRGERVGTGKLNFCFPEKAAWYNRALRYIPETGMGLGLVAFAISGGVSLGPIGIVVGAYKGVMLGGKIGIAVEAGLLLTGLMPEDPSEWPGIEH